MLSSKARASVGSSAGVLPPLTMCCGPRTDPAGLVCTPRPTAQSWNSSLPTSATRTPRLQSRAPGRRRRRSGPGPQGTAPTPMIRRRAAARRLASFEDDHDFIGLGPFEIRVDKFVTTARWRLDDRNVALRGPLLHPVPYYPRMFTLVP